MKRKELFFLFLLLVSLFALYFNGLKADFIMDDEIFIKNNIRIRQETNILNFFKTGYWTYSGEIRDYDYYRPIVLLSFYLDFKIYGTNYEGFRITNILLLFFFSFFFFLFVKDILKLDYNTSAISTILMAFHPIHSENIAWIVGRNEIMYLMWGFAFLYFSGKYLKEKGKIALIISHMVFLIGLFTKETFILFFPIIILLDIIVLKSKNYKFFISFTPSLVLIYAIRSSVIKNSFLFYKIKPLSASIYKIIASFGFYLKNLLFPLYFDKLMEPYNLSNIKSQFFIGIILILLSLLLFYKYLKEKNKTELFSLVFSLFFVSFFATMVLRYFLPAVTRYLSAAVPGIAILEAIYINKLKTNLKTTIITIIFIVFTIQIILNNSLFLSQERYFSYMIKKVPYSAYQKIHLCRIKIKKGDYPKAIDTLRKMEEQKLMRLNFILFNFCKSDIYKRAAMYDKALLYLKMANKKIGNRIEKSWILIHLVDILRRVGNYEKAESLLYDYQNKFGDLYDLDAILWEIEISQLEWEKANKIEKKIREKFGYFSGKNTYLLKKIFDKFNELEKISFFEKYLNYEKALENLYIIKNKTSPFEYKLKEIELLFKIGDEKKAVELVKILYNNTSNPKELFICSNFFKKEIIRPDFSILFLKKLKNKISEKRVKNQIQKEINFLSRYKYFFD